MIDGAASFAGLAERPDRFLGAIPVAISFHATKAFATGEGGAVATSDVDLAQRSAQALNFGVSSIRDCRMASTNGKMSEYHAAVGLAELDGWPENSLPFAPWPSATSDRWPRPGSPNAFTGRPTSGRITRCFGAATRQRSIGWSTA